MSSDASSSSQWETVELGEVCSFRAGSAFKPDRQGKSQGVYPFIKVRDLSHVENTRFILAADNWVDEEDVTALKAKPFYAGTVVFAKIGEALKANRFRVLVRDTLIDNNMMGATPDPARVDPEFFHYLLQESRLPDLANGSAMPYLKQSDLVKAQVHLPPIGEQRRIASVLGALNDKIEGNYRLGQTLEDIAAALFKARFVDFAGHEDLAESEIGPIPRDWRVAMFSDAVAVNPPVRSVKRGSVVPHIGMADVPAWGVRPTHIEESEYSGGARFEPEDTLMARITGCIEHGKGAFVDFLDGPGAGSTEFLVFRAIPPLTPEMVFLLSRTARVRSHAIANMSGSSGRQRVTTAALDHLPIAIPTDSVLIEDEARIFRAVFRQTRALWRENQTLVKLRDLLLPRLISGRIQVEGGADAVK